MRLGLWNAGLAALLCAAGSAACAQQEKPATTATTTTASPTEHADIPTSGSAGTMNVQAKLVVMPAVVRDKKGALVNDLKKENFSLEVDGQPQAIRYFDHDTDVPLTLGLLVDVSGSMRNEVDVEKSASQSFLDTMLAPAAANRAADKAFVVQFAKEVELLQDVTDAKPRLQRALKELGTSSPSFHNADDTSSGPNTDSEGRYIRHGGTALYDAIYLSGDEVMSKQAGKRRALVVMTDGVDRGSKESLTDAIEAAQRSDTIVYGIYYKGEQPHQDFNRAGGGTGGIREVVEGIREVVEVIRVGGIREVEEGIRRVAGRTRVRVGMATSRMWMARRRWSGSAVRRVDGSSRWVRSSPSMTSTSRLARSCGRSTGWVSRPRGTRPRTAITRFRWL